MDILHRLGTWTPDSAEEREMLEACENEIARLRDALRSIRAHVEPQPSALAKAIIATCDSALAPSS